MSLLLLSDLHVFGPEDPLYLALLNLLRRRAGPGDTVVFAGDVFDVFVGDKKIFRNRYSEFIQAAQEAGERGVALHYIEGNHDFLVRRAFKDIAGMTIHSEQVSVTLDGKRFYVSHGDLVNRKDYGYRVLRAFFRSPLMKALVSVIPGKWLDQIGQSSSYQSRKSKPSLPKELPTDRMENLRRIYRSHAAERLAQGYDFVVMGHCHDLDEMWFNIGGRPGQYVNMGFPRIHGSFLSWIPGDDRIHRERLP